MEKFFNERIEQALSDNKSVEVEAWYDKLNALIEEQDQFDTYLSQALDDAKQTSNVCSFIKQNPVLRYDPAFIIKYIMCNGNDLHNREYADDVLKFLHTMVDLFEKETLENIDESESPFADIIAEIKNKF